jgi:hypothetical protein
MKPKVMAEEFAATVALPQDEGGKKAIKKQDEREPYSIGVS